MIVRENVSLAPFTTLGVGGSAQFFIEADTTATIKTAITWAQTERVPLYALGEGSNLLVPDEGVQGLVLRIRNKNISVTRKKDFLEIIAEAGVLWEEVVQKTEEEEVFGLENLAAIPGSVAGAAVQNIGAYGSEFSTVFISAEIIDLSTGMKKQIEKNDSNFGYRTSFFKNHPHLLITEVTLQLPYASSPNLSYPDLKREKEKGTPLTTPRAIATAVRAIRAQKFPQKGSAGSFFKNPIVTASVAGELVRQFPSLPTFPQGKGKVKLSLAWILDHVLSRKGYARGPVRLYEKQPLVIVANEGATATDVDVFAKEIETLVYTKIGIAIEREVETFGTRINRAN